MKGNPPVPTALAIAKGDTRKIGVNKLDERLAAEPKPQKGLPDAPEHLQGLALQTYNFWREQLELMNLDFMPDAQLLEGAALNYERAIDAELMIARDGIIRHVPIFDKNGEEIGERMERHPAIAVANQAWKIVKAFCTEFAMSPVSRTRVALKAPDDGSADLAKLLGAPREKKGAVQ